jgi:glycosyltransferase involved in cell wall biosynthesis
VFCRLLWDGGVQRVAIAETVELRRRRLACTLTFLRRARSSHYALPEGTIVCAESGGKASGLLSGLTSQFAPDRGEDATIDLDLMWGFRHEFENDYDVIVCHDQYASFLGAYLRYRKSIPYVMVFHEFSAKPSATRLGQFLRPVVELLDWVTLFISPAIVTSSGSHYNRLRRVLGPKVYLARLGTDSRTSITPVAQRDRYGVVSLSVWDEGRHPEFYLALAQKMPTFRFTIAGSWADQAYHKNFLEQARGVQNLTITGAISEEDRISLLNRNLIYMRFGFGEAGPGMGGLEALSCGNIVIANAGIGLAEIISHGRNGFTVESLGQSEIQNLLIKISSLSTRELESISQSALRLAESNDWSLHTSQLLSAMDHAIALVLRKSRNRSVEIRNPAD